MAEQHPSTSAVGAHFDEEAQIAALAHRYYEEEGRPEGRSHEHWMRAKRELFGHTEPASQESSAAPPTEADLRTEQAMHLAQ
jgi:hypothetical protein